MGLLLRDGVHVVHADDDAASHPLVHGEGMEEQHAREQNGNDVAKDHRRRKHQGTKVFDYVINNQLTKTKA